MKFIKESIEFPSSKNKVKECVHPLREEKRISRKWGHTWYFDDNYDIVKVKAKDGTVLRRGEPFEAENGGKLVINGFDPDTNTVYVVEADDYDPNFDGGADYAVEDIVKIFKYWDEQPVENTSAKGPELTSSKGLKESNLVTIKFKDEELKDLPGFPTDAYWYTNRYAITFDYKETSNTWLVKGEKEDIDRFIKSFGLKATDESLNEETEHAIYRVTYVVDKDANIFSAVMINARGEADAQSVFLKKFPDTEILGIRKLDDREVETNKKKGMSLIEDLEVGELEHEEAEEGNNPEPPVAGEESAAASLINSLIRDEWLAIEQYNSAMVNLKEYGVDEKIIEVLNHIMFDENTHVGNLQEVLALLAPATNKIEKGNEQAEQILNNEDTKSGDDK